MSKELEVISELRKGPMVQLTRGEMDHCINQAVMKDAWSRAVGIRDEVGDKPLHFLTPSMIGIMGELAVAKYFNLFPDLEWGLKNNHKHYDLETTKKVRLEIKTTTQMGKNIIPVKAKYKPGHKGVELFSDEIVWVKMEVRRPIYDPLANETKFENLVVPNFYLVGRMDEKTFRENRTVTTKRKDGLPKYWGIHQSHCRSLFPIGLYGEGART